VAGFCEHGNETSVHIKGAECLKYLSDCRLNFCVRWRYLFLIVIQYITVERCSVLLNRSTKKMLFSANVINEDRLEL
jgi:hypothetical protein